VTLEETGGLTATVAPNGAVNVADQHAGVIELRPDVWDELCGEIRDGFDQPTTAWIRVGQDAVTWTGVPPGHGTLSVTLRFTLEQWAAFVDAVRGGQYTLNALAAA
jgi:hypothetical protein